MFAFPPLQVIYSLLGVSQTGCPVPHPGGPGEPSSSVVSITSGVMAGLSQTGCTIVTYFKNLSHPHIDQNEAGPNI